jgi:hypothetical protein
LTVRLADDLGVGECWHRLPTCRRPSARPTPGSTCRFPRRE